MATPLKDLVKETSTTTGTGTYSLAGAVDGFRSFLAAYGSGTTADVFYVAVESGVGYEEGRGTYDGTADTLARTEILTSSNSDAAVDWPAGTRQVFVVIPGEEVLLKRDNLDGIADAATARTNLGVAAAALRDVGVSAGSDIPDRDAGDTRYAQIGTLPAPSGTQLLFPGGSIPAGWTRQDEAADYVWMGAKSGESAGATGGDWSPSGAFTVAGHALTIAQMPQHTHEFFYTTDIFDATGTASAVDGLFQTTQTGSTQANSSTTGSGSTHTHGISDDGTWRPQHKRVVRASKD